MEWNNLLGTHGSHTLHGIPRGTEGIALAQAWAASKASILFIASSDRDMEQVRSMLAFFAPSAEVLVLPAWDCLPYDRVSPNVEVLSERLVTLARMASAPAIRRIVLTTINAALQRLPRRDIIRPAVMELRVGQHITQSSLAHFLVENGYRRSATAMEAGEFAVRGSLVDVIVPGAAAGVRIDQFGDDIETLRSFDPASQTTIASLDAFTLLPASEVMLNEPTISCFRENFRKYFGANVTGDPLYEAISEGRSYPGMEHLLPLFYGTLETLFEYMPGAAVICDGQMELAHKERSELVQEYYLARKDAAVTKSYGTATYRALPPEELYITQEGWTGRLEHTSMLTLSSFTPEGATQTLGMRLGVNFSSLQLAGDALFARVKESVTAARAKGCSTLVACYSNGSRERIAGLLEEHGIHALRLESAQQMGDVGGKTVGLIVLPLEHGFESPQLHIISEQDLLGERVIRTGSKRKKPQNVLALASNFMPGELVVHREHGIGRFEGLLTLEVQGALHDCLKVIYKGDDKLFLPVENIELLSRYGTEDEQAELDKLGSASWQARKAKLKERISIAAEELIRIAAARELHHATPLEQPQGLYEEFCARFPYAETDDQARAIEDVMSDIAAGKPADRLVCGDVGFGKTEVALRAAFVAASCANEHGPVQVAVVCPTTLLCRQHFKTFSERFHGLPFTVRQLSRLTTKHNKETTEALEQGKVNIVIGTHALLGKAIKFKNLGLLIIDEEQHFGVAQKEKLKAMRADIHVLTLTATPIPRTLQLALSGVRELSIIATPPVDRIAVRTFVMPVDPVVLRESILREFHRGGKIFYVTPRIEYMAELGLMLKEIVPEIRIATAHGQMTPAALDTVMNEFYEGKFDLLLSTSIVESGLDIPSANTIIIDRAHMFGLSQLYQMRGRVGRGKVRAYAYFTLPHRRTLSDAATRRLEVMQTLDSLGAGFTLASHDMDIRGFGNLLGDEQSGHVREVGIELYQSMLEDAVAAARAHKKQEKVTTEEKWSPQINLGMTVMIPESYVQDLELRLTLYRRAAALETEDEIHSFRAELIDRFGTIPDETQHLLLVVRLKQLCLAASIERIDTGPKGAVISFRNNHFAKPEALLRWITMSAAKAKLRPDQKLVIMKEWNDMAQKLKDVELLLTAIVELLK